MVFLWLAALVACDDTTFKSHVETVEGEGVDAVVQVFAGNCVDCHMGASGSAGLALDGNFCDTTVDVEAQSGTGILIVPGNKEDSVLYQRIVDASRPMPPTGVMADSNTGIVGQWIDDGADCSGIFPSVEDENDDAVDAETDFGDGPEAAAARVFADSCVDCHRGPRPAGGVGLDADLCEQVVNQVGGSGLLLVAPNDAEGSLLYQRMLDEAAPMPPSGLLDLAETDAVKDWINNGAECGEVDDSGSVNEAFGDEEDSGMLGESEDEEESEPTDEGAVSTPSEDSVSDPVPTFADVYLIFDSESTHCTACHDDTRPSGGLGMHTQEEAYENLLADPPGALGPLVVPGDAAASALVSMMRGDPYYSPMPPIDDYPDYSLVSPVILDVVIDWINGGAPE